MNRPDTLGKTHLEHLINYARTRGRFWRSKLREYWCMGITHGFLDSDEAASLQHIRNNIGLAINKIRLSDLERWEEDDLYREAASEMFHRDGELEIDADAKISRGDDEGAYVQAWVWVSNADLNKAA